jgi:hypothetical protein
MMNRIVQLAASALAWVALALSPPAFGQSTTTTTNSTSTQIGVINARFAWLTESIGPTLIVINELNGCTLAGPPYDGCTLVSGSGTPADQYEYVCSTQTAQPPPPLTGCSGGTPFEVLSGTVNLNIHFHTIRAGATPTPHAVPLRPWVPIVSAAGVLLVALRLRRHRRQTPG